MRGQRRDRGGVVEGREVLVESHLVNAEEAMYD